MSAFPDAPVSPSSFMQDILPALFAEAEKPAELAEVDLRLGVMLAGDDGGEWVMHIHAGGLDIEVGSRDGAPFTVVQTVDDWRGALWEGRGGVVGETAAALFRQAGPTAASGPVPGGAPDATVIGQLEGLGGMFQIVVTGGEGGDWSTGIKFGAGEIPAEPNTTVSITDDDARAMSTGELDAMQAFIGGKIVVAGDMALMMQMQAILMQAAAAAAAKARGSS